MKTHSFLFSENIKLTFTFQPLLFLPIPLSISLKNYSIVAEEIAQKFKTPTVFAKDKYRSHYSHGVTQNHL